MLLKLTHLVANGDFWVAVRFQIIVNSRYYFVITAAKIGYI
jgi:hypothetical protein